MNISPIKSFHPEIFEKLKYYVYRLIDPRDGSTFYVGYGQKNRVFSHLEEARKGEATTKNDDSEKVDLIREILNEGLEPIHVIHRHGIMTRESAELVEASLMDAFPGLTNAQGGIGSDIFGAAHVNQIKTRYSSEKMVFDSSNRLILIKINKSIKERSVYEAVRHAWKMQKEKAEKAQYVLAIDAGICVGVFQPAKWLLATVENFPSKKISQPDRIGFIEENEAPKEVKNKFLFKRLPEKYTRRGLASSFLYINI